MTHSQTVLVPNGLKDDAFMQQFPHHERFMAESAYAKPKIWNLRHWDPPKAVPSHHASMEF